jgi:hypothetical protein
VSGLNPFGGGGKGGRSSSGPSYNDVSGIGLAELAQAQPLLKAGMDEFMAGASGRLTPAMQALSDQEIQQANTNTRSMFGNLGIGPSTMMTQDLNTNLLGNEAMTAGLENEEQTAGLSALAQALGFEQTGTGAYGAGNQAALQLAQQQGQAKAGILGSAGTGYSQGTGPFGFLQNWLGSGSGGGAVDTGTWDTGLSTVAADSGAVADASGAVDTGVWDLVA